MKLLSNWLSVGHSVFRFHDRYTVLKEVNKYGTVPARPSL
jgi:hypothetical protein